MDKEYAELTEEQTESLTEEIISWLRLYAPKHRTNNERSGLYDGICLMAEVMSIDPATLYNLLDEML